MTLLSIRRLFLPSLKLSLCFSLLACQVPLAHVSPRTATLASGTTDSSVLPSVLTPVVLPLQAEGLAGQLTLSSHAGQEQLSWSQTTGFQLQGVRRSDVKTLRLRLRGLGITQALETSAAVVSQSQWPSLSLGPVPQGRFRVVTVEGLDINGDPLPGFRASYVYHSPANGVHSATLLRLENPLADLVLRLLAEQPDFLQAIDLAALRSRMASLSGELSLNRYPHDPDFIDSNAIFALFDFNGPAGVLPELAAMQAAALKDPLTLNLYLQTPDGENLAEELQLVLNHPTVGAKTLSAGQSFYQVQFERLFYQGTASQRYTLRVFNSSQSVDLSLTVEVAADGSLTLDPDNTLGGANGVDAAHPLLLTGVSQSGFTTYFVSPTGNNGQSGRSVTTAWQSIQHAVNMATAGSRIEVAPGIYSENVSINKVLTLVGAGSGSDPATATHLIATTPGTGNGLELSGNGSTDSERLSVSHLRLSGFLYGIPMSGKHISLDNVVVRDNSVGLRVSSTADLQDLKIRNSLIEDNHIGFYAGKDNPDASNLHQVEISQTQFLRNRQKGLYFEKLSAAVFDGLTLTDNGSDTNYAWNTGLELNLKWKWGADQNQNYSGIEIKNSSFSGNGVLGTATNRMNPVSLAIKARDDAPEYNASGKPPAALSDVRLENNVIHAPVNALRLGKSDKNSAATTGVVLANNQFSLSGTDSEPRYLINNQTTVAVTATEGNTLNGLIPSAENAFAIENLIWDKLDQSNLGRVNLGLPAGQLFLPYHSDGSLIQNAINLASPGDTLTLQDGIYNLNGRSLNLNKGITLQGQSLNTRLQQAYNVTDSTHVLNISASGARLRQLQIEKTNKAGTHNLVQVMASQVTLEDLQISGIFENGDGDVSRAIEVTGGLSGLLIQNNVIFKLRQPAYINLGTTGTLTGNRVYETRGWVIDGARLDFSSSSRWRSDGEAVTADLPSQNFGCDIALLNHTNGDYLAFYGALGSLENSLGDLLPAGPGMTGCDQRVLP